MQKTTITGILSIIATIITGLAIPLLDGDTLDGSSLSTVLTSILTAVGLIFAKDSKPSGGGNSGGSDEGGSDSAATIKSAARKAGLFLFVVSPLLLLSACGHDLAVTADAARIDRDGASLVLDKAGQSITYTQHAPTPPESPVIIQTGK